MNILIIAAHPDDETLGCGGTIAKHVAYGDEVSLCVLTDGVTARHNKIKKQQQICKKAVNHLGVTKVNFLGLKDQKLDTYPLLEIIQKIGKEIKDTRPERVYTHFIGDLNKDHQIAAEATFVAARPFSFSIQLIYSYEVPSSTEWGVQQFSPNFYVNITLYMEKKVEAFLAYSSEMKPAPHPRSNESICSIAKVRGSQSGYSYAESFILVRGLWE